jgi:cyclophilin family peptidyl-prolyl cis-trans isomerase
MRMRRRIGAFLALTAAAAAGLAEPARAGAPVLECSDPAPLAGRGGVDLATDFGTIRFELLNAPGEFPAPTVENFLNYVERGDYDGSFFHRLIPGFVLQGGGYTYDPTNRYLEIAKDPPIANRYEYCNRRGTVAMAKTPINPDTATSEFFVNLADNSAILEPQNGGFTVFARVRPEDMAKIDAIAALHREYGPFMIDDPDAEAFTNLPVKSILQRPANGFGCLLSINPDPDPNLGPSGNNQCASQPELDAAIELWKDGMDASVPPQLVMVQSVPEPGQVALLAAGAATLFAARRASRRRVS